MAAETPRHPFEIGDQKTFETLFPPSGTEIPPISKSFTADYAQPVDVQSSQPLGRTKSSSSSCSNSSSDSIVTDNAGVDYVVVFRFPTELKKKDETFKSRADLEAHVARSLTSLMDRLTKVNLRYQVRPGTEEGTLLILVSGTPAAIKKQYRQERVRDFLLGVRVDDIKGDENADSIDQSFNDLSEAERLRLVYEILTQLENEGGAGISSHIDTYVESVTPLHDDQFNNKWIKSLSTKWFISDQDMTQIRDQFGEKVAYYFAFLQSYFLWLGIPSVLGLFVYFTHSNTLVPWFSIAMMIWSIVFIEMWNRREQELALKWGVRNYSKYEKKRAEFKGEKMMQDPVTGEQVPFVSTSTLLARRASSLPGVAIAAFLLSIIVGFVFVLQLFLHEYYNGPFRGFLHFAPTVGYVLFIPQMTAIYSKWVKTLTDWEMHKTDASWEYSYTQKIFVANFLVGYLSLLITAWVYIPFGDHVLPYLAHYNISHEHQTVDFLRLRAQLVYFVVTGQLIGFVTEMGVPYLMKLVMPHVKKFMKKRTAKPTKSSASSVSSGVGHAAEIETEKKPTTDEGKFMKKVYKEVAMEEYNIYADYVEMVIQFGYVSMFSTVWPLTALCSMINNWVELRGDAVKVCKYTRRPIPHRADTIGPWLGNMKTLVWLSSITMGSFAYLFHPSTDIHSPYTPIFTLLAILVSEHLYMGLKEGVYQALKLMPSWSDWAIRKEDYDLKKLWLDRMVGSRQEFIARSDIAVDDNSDLVEGLSGDMWNQHLDRNAETLYGAQIIESAFKTI